MNLIIYNINTNTKIISLLNAMVYNSEKSRLLNASPGVGDNSRRLSGAVQIAYVFPGHDCNSIIFHVILEFLLKIWIYRVFTSNIWDFPHILFILNLILRWLLISITRFLLSSCFCLARQIGSYLISYFMLNFISFSYGQSYAVFEYFRPGRHIFPPPQKKLFYS